MQGYHRLFRCLSYVDGDLSRCDNLIMTFRHMAPIRQKSLHGFASIDKILVTRIFLTSV